MSQCLPDHSATSTFSCEVDSDNTNGAVDIGTIGLFGKSAVLLNNEVVEVPSQMTLGMYQQMMLNPELYENNIQDRVAPL